MMDRSDKPAPNSKFRIPYQTRSHEEIESWAETLQLAICPSARVSTCMRDDDSKFMFITGCKRWTCDVCGPQNKRKTVAKILAGNPKRFMTLTVRAPSDDNDITWTPREAFDFTRRKCARLFQIMNRETKSKTEYVRILEQTEKGYPHYHYLTRGPYWPQERVSAIWNELTGAYIVDIRKPPNSKTATRYIAKYLTKQSQVEFTQRRISYSRNFIPKKSKFQKSEFKWWKFERDHWTEAVNSYEKNFHLIPTDSAHSYQLIPKREKAERCERLQRQFEIHNRRFAAKTIQPPTAQSSNLAF